MGQGSDKKKLNIKRDDVFALCMAQGIGPVKVMSLINEGAVNIDEALTLQERISSVKRSRKYSDEFEYMAEEGVNWISCVDNKYPGLLKNIYDPPSVLFYKGSLVPEDANAVAIVGSRRCSVYGMQMAEKLAYGLAEKGITVVSGMARGIDTAAHRGALKAGGRTIAVLGSGFGHVYPAGTEELVAEISSNGAVVTEYFSDVFPDKWSFPRRNRIISGMSKGIVVVEAAKKSGALITADFALDQGREVFALPGRANSIESTGTNLLIQKGAKLVLHVDDILDELDFSPVEGSGPFGDQRPEGRSIPDITEDERSVLDTLELGASVHFDQILSETGISIDKMSQILIELELKGRVVALAGKRYTYENKVFIHNN